MMTDVTITPFDGEKSYKEMEAIERLVWPDDFETAEEHMHGDSSTPEQHYWTRCMARLNSTGAAVGWMWVKAAYWWDEPGQYVFDMSVLPDYQGQGIGKALWAHAVELMAAQSAASTTVWIREDIDRAKRFLLERGFEYKMRDAQSLLEIGDFDFDKFAWVDAKMSAENIKLLSITELKAIEPEWQQKVWALRWPIRRDIPSPSPMTQTPFDEWLKRVVDSPTFLPDGYLVAIHEPTGEYVGYSHVELAQGDPKKLYTAVTGVKREFRRKAIATALKVRIVQYAHGRGVERIQTENEENNPMYDLNMQLGFKPIPAWLTYKKVF